MSKNSIIVEIHRALQLAHEAQSEALEFHNAGSKGVGSYWDKSKIATGLTFEEEKILLPDIIGFEAADREFRKEVEKYYVEITTKVPPSTGIALEIGLTEDNAAAIIAPHTNPDGTKNPGNLPLNVLDYIRYRHAIKHPHVAMSEKASKGNQMKQFYIKNKGDVAKQQSDTNNLKDKALTEYLNIKQDPKKVKMMLVNLGEVNKTKDLDINGQIIELKLLAERNPKLFVETADDKDLVVKYEINSMISVGLLERIADRIIYKESGDTLGNSMKEAILTWKDPAESQNVSSLKARFKELVSKADNTKNKQEELN